MVHGLVHGVVHGLVHGLWHMVHGVIQNVLLELGVVAHKILVSAPVPLELIGIWV